MPVLFSSTELIRNRSAKELLFASLSFYANLVMVTESTGAIPVLSATITKTDAICHGSSSGTITFSDQTGGSENYEYSIDNGESWQINPAFTGIPHGLYSPVIRDQNNTLLIKSYPLVSITQPQGIEATLYIENTTTVGDIGKIHFIINENLEPLPGERPISQTTYQYTIDGGVNWQGSRFFNDLPAGNYNCAIRDADNPQCVTIINDNVEILAI